MVGMLQIITYMPAFYLVVKGMEILQIALASNREKRDGIITIGVLMLIACIVAAGGLVVMQDQQARSVGRTTSAPSPQVRAGAMTEPRDVETLAVRLRRTLLGAGMPPARHHGPALSRQPGAPRTARQKPATSTRATYALS
jgi:hypothetical protein